MVVRVCRVITILLLVVSPALADTTPPKRLHLVGDHWTAYNPPDPANFPAGAKVHIIERGDTLWDLASTYYGDPYLWPQLWENNTYITDAHWIYPGDPILLESEGVVEEIVLDEIDPQLEDEDVIMIEEADSLVPMALGTVSDIYCFGYLGHVGEQYPNVIAGFEDSEVKYMELAMDQSIGVTVDDVIYIDGGTSTGLVAGETYMAVAPSELVEHPATGEVIGQHYDFKGRVTILCADATTATAMVMQACDAIHLGDRLKPLPQIPIPLATLGEFERHCQIPSNRTSGDIVNA
ncbi:MAG: LysM peptidoglycan-binding domain-containing protein [Acidobacteria bacterium]|nr:LysM peptidoglycan-binding domain-containing protein [Acidobacteriota bacterium]